MHSFISFSKTLSDLFVFQNPTRFFFCASDDKMIQIAYYAELLDERTRCVFFLLFSENNDVYEAIRSSWEKNEVYEAIMNSDDLQTIDL